MRSRAAACARVWSSGSVRLEGWEKEDVEVAVGVLLVTWPWSAGLRPGRGRNHCKVGPDGHPRPPAELRATRTPMCLPKDR
jgi:hypothetical protein